jgi:outer membrane biosynthesis protein TonB
MTRPVIPGPPAADAPTDTYAIFDLLVDRQGNVEQVKTVSVPSRYRDKMIVAHLKAWGFKPATRDGQPVRYRIRIRLIV